MTSYQYILNPIASEKPLSAVESHSEIIEEIQLTDAGVMIELTGSEAPIEFFDAAEPLIDAFTVTFNESPTSPGFTVFLRGLLDAATEFNTMEVFRRDPTGRYQDRRVRGLANVDVLVNEMTVTDYEVPLNTEFIYYLRLHFDGGTFDFGPVDPTPQTYIPTQTSVYGDGIAYIRLLDAPEVSQPVLIQNMNEWQRQGRVYGEYQVLGRRNPVVITDVMGGREGTLEGLCFLDEGQSYEDIEDVINPGSTILVQNHNPTQSAFYDMYIKVEQADFERHTKTVYYGERQNPIAPTVIVSFSLDYIEVDRPDPTAVILPDQTWETVYESHTSWGHVNERYESWKDVLLDPVGPVHIEHVVEEFTSENTLILPNNTVNPVTVECWGGGAPGFDPGTTASTGGGGGGAYAMSMLNLIPGNTYTMNPADPSQPSNFGSEEEVPASVFGDSDGNVLVRAVGGNTGTSAADTELLGGLGGQAEDCLGQYNFSGGDGGTQEDSFFDATGGGGGAAGFGEHGKNGEDAQNDTVPGSGGDGGSLLGGDGGDGGVEGSSDAQDGQSPGGGGGGQPVNQVGGTGARGLVRVIYKLDVSEESS